MPKSSVAQKNFVGVTSRMPRTIATLTMRMAMDRERQLAQAERIRELRGARPQPLIADAVGVTLRAYQGWEAGGGIAWANLNRLANFHGVSTNYLQYGSDDGPTGETSQLDRIEGSVRDIDAKIDRLLNQIAALDLERATAGAAARTRTRARNNDEGSRAPRRAADR